MLDPAGVGGGGLRRSSCVKVLRWLLVPDLRIALGSLFPVDEVISCTSEPGNERVVALATRGGGGAPNRKLRSEQEAENLFSAGVVSLGGGGRSLEQVLLQVLSGTFITSSPHMIEPSSP